jgi:hypothetical protein
MRVGIECGITAKGILFLLRHSGIRIPNFVYLEGYHGTV